MQVCPVTCLLLYYCYQMKALLALHLFIASNRPAFIGIVSLDPPFWCFCNHILVLMVLIENNMQLSTYMYRCKVCVDIFVTDYVLRFLWLCCISFPLYICLINRFTLFYMLSVHSVGKSCNSCGVGQFGSSLCPWTVSKPLLY